MSTQLCSQAQTDGALSKNLTIMPTSPKRQATPAESPTVKRPKISPEEKARLKEAKEREKVAKEAEKLLREREKAAKDAEKEAERAVREAEKEAKRLEKEEKRKLKEEIRAKENAAIEKKEKSQLRMGNFFKKADPKLVPVLAREESSIFKPFHLRENTTLADCRLKNIIDAEDFDRSLEIAAVETRPPTGSLFKSEKRTRRRDQGDRGKRQKRLTLRERLIQVSDIPLEERLKDIVYKLVQFHSDVRPAYFGTMTTVPKAKSLRSGRNPYRKTDELNYDYDSEADWIEGDDEDLGEEIGDDDDMSVMSRDTYGDDDEDFLDDTEDATPHEKRTQGQLIPSVLGIFHSGNSEGVQHMKLQKLLDTPGPIDPFHNYWDDTPTRDVVSIVSPAKETPGKLATSLKSRKLASTGGVCVFPEKLLPDFRKAIQGCSLTKLLLVEKLRVDFKAHKVSKKAIEDKLAEVAHRQGKGQHDVWTLRD